MIRLRASAIVMVTTVLLGASCAEDNPDAPPEVAYGVSVCAECDMIISDERYAAATVIADARGRPTPLLFDDIGDQISYEATHTDLTILSRWVHDHATHEWVPAASATYVRSPELRTPMASGIAAFRTRAAADAARSELTQGVVLTFTELWQSASPNVTP